MLRLVGVAVLVVVAAVGAGWVWGASGRAETEQARRTAELRAEFAEARAWLLEARVSLFLVNFGDAGRAFDEARARITALQTHLREIGKAERAGRLEIVLAQVGDAGRLTLALDARAHAAADQALRTLAASAVP